MGHPHTTPAALCGIGRLGACSLIWSLGRRDARTVALLTPGARGKRKKLPHELVTGKFFSQNKNQAVLRLARNLRVRAPTAMASTAAPPSHEAGSGAASVMVSLPSEKVNASFGARPMAMSVPGSAL